MMSEIRDRVENQILSMVRAASPNACSQCGSDLTSHILAEQAVAYILSIPELSIVERGADLPEKEFVSANENYRYREAQIDMLKAGWVKEIKDNAT